MPGSFGRVNEENRRQWLKKVLLDLPAGSRILDAGAGEQQYRDFCSHLNYVSQDFAGYDPAQLSHGLQMKQWKYPPLDIICDITSIPELDSSFDAILCTEVIEHISNPIACLKEFSRLLKPGGYLILTAPFSSLTHFAPHFYYSGFSRYFYEKELADSGFKILKLIPNGNYFDYLAQELLRLKVVGRRYSKNFFLSRVESWILRSVLKILARLSRNDSGSSELACYGYHVVALKSN